MAKIPRKTLKQFGSNAGLDSFFGQFGSKSAGLPQTSRDLTVIQQLAAWLDGWQDAVVGGNKVSFLQDMNGLHYVFGTELCYLFQMGIPEWDAATTYDIRSVVQGPVGGPTEGQWFESQQVNNTGNVPPTGASNAQWKWINPPTPPVPNVGNSLKSNLVVKPNNGSPNTSVDVSADTLSVQNVALQAVAATANITVAGAGGLDAGAPAANTWYALHVICNASGGLVSALLSLSATAPALPAGYTSFRRVSWVRTTAVAAIVQKAQRTGDTVRYLEPTWTQLHNPAPGVTSFASYIPPGVAEGKFTVTAQVTNSIVVSVRTPGAAAYINVASDLNGTGSVQCASAFDWLVDSGRNLDFAVAFPSGSLSMDFYVPGYSDPV